MHIHQFEDYQKYLATERAGSRYRMGRKSNAIPGEIDRVIAYFHANRDRPIMKVICHGARDGTEVRLFRERCVTDAEIIGTDVFAKDPTCVIEWDYHETKPEWAGAFDVVYSNSLDHSPKPQQCLTTWLSQLKPDGLLFIDWTPAHTLEERPLPYPGGDCFGAAIHEYIQIAKNAGGVIQDLLWCPIEAKLDHVVIVVGRKQ